MADVNIRNEANELRLLFEISQTLDGAEEELSDHLEDALALMARHTGMMRGTVTLVDPECAEIIVEASYGLNEQELGRAHYKLGEGITGKVIQRGTPMVVPHISEEPHFLNRTGARDLQKEDISFLCVPILLKGKAVGALSADKLFADSICLEEDLRLLQVLASLISRAVQHRLDIRSKHAAVMEENRRLQRMIHGSLESGSLVGDSAATRQLMLEIAKVSASNATVLIQGESGTGKELVAGLIHSNSPRAGRPLVKVNCAALPENLIESELFGHERGAFTGAVGAKKGRFEMAHSGTLFLDEVGELSLVAQAKLLRALQEKEFERVGGTRTLQVDVRLIAATNQNLEAMVAAGSFRQDLYYRINVFPLHSPPLRERMDDIIPLASYFVQRHNKECGRQGMRISAAASALLLGYAWPGNIRELQNVMERAVILCGAGDLIDACHLPFLHKDKAAHDAPATVTPLNDALAALEKRLIIESLKAEQGNMAKAAERLGITERIIGLRMKAYGLDYKSFRQKDIASEVLFPVKVR
ncbi:sigma 54-interacting transcriptional regulator [Desulfovibrio sp. OttesenSCG-928-M16]|nr:sigma 54-interacting transcriptional regulator [Desulfovibrio sp. OttesenSCG-928-M16]